MKKILILFLLVIVLTLGACSKKASTKTVTDEATGEKMIVVSTPYTDVKLPGEFEGNVVNEVTSKDPYTLTFKAKEDGTEIFSLIFNGDGSTGTLVGTLIGEDENTVIYMDFPEIDVKNPNYAEYCELQEDSSDVLQHLFEDNEFEKNAIIESAPKEETFDIKTDVFTLKYPKKWKNKIRKTVNDEGVEFSYKDTPLFAFYFNESEIGTLLGTYNDVPVFVKLFEIDKDKFDESEYKEISAMQEASNVILDYLEEDENFTMREIQ